MIPAVSPNENLYFRLKMNTDSNKNHIYGKDSILCEIPYFLL